ncbi:PAS domain-containing protein [bacterium]|nr:PAS domain-containing protein [bacterium]
MIGAFEAIALLGYTVALVALLYGAFASPMRSKAPLLFLAAAMALMVFVSTSNTLEHLEITGVLDPFEDYAEILFLPLVAYGLYGYLVSAQGAEIDSVRHAVESEHSMLLEILEHVPVGIAIVDVGGRIGYANPVVRRLLRLEDDATVAGFKSPGKVWRLDASAEPEGILTVDPGEAFERVPYLFKTPDSEVRLLVSATPMRPEPPHGASVVTILPVGDG